MAERIFFIVNPRSANGRTGQGWAERQRVLAQALGEFGVGMTEGALHAGQLARLLMTPDRLESQRIPVESHHCIQVFHR